MKLSDIETYGDYSEVSEDQAYEWVKSGSWSKTKFKIWVQAYVEQQSDSLDNFGFKII